MKQVEKITTAGIGGEFNSSSEYEQYEVAECEKDFSSSDINGDFSLMEHFL